MEVYSTILLALCFETQLLTVQKLKSVGAHGVRNLPLGNVKVLSSLVLLSILYFEQYIYIF